MTEMLLTLLAALVSPALVVDGQAVPSAQVRLVAGRTLVSCRWLENHAADWHCFDARPNGVTQVSVSPVRGPQESLREAVFTAGGTRVRTLESPRWVDLRSWPDRALFGQEVYVPVRVLAREFGAPLQWNAGQLKLDHPASFNRLMTTLSGGLLTQAREALEGLKHRSQVVMPTPGGRASETNDTVRLWPEGEVRRQFVWADDIVTFNIVEDGWLTTHWAARTAGPYEQAKGLPIMVGEDADTLNRYLRWPLREEVGKRDPISGPLSFAAGHIFGIATTRFWGTVTPDGQEVTRLEAYYQYGERLVSDGQTGLRPATEPLPEPFFWEQRLPR